MKAKMRSNLQNKKFKSKARLVYFKIKIGLNFVFSYYVRILNFDEKRKNTA